LAWPELGSTSQDQLGSVVALDSPEPRQPLIHGWGVIEQVGLVYVTEPAVEALDHLVGFRRGRWGQSKLNTQTLAPIKLENFTGFACLRGEQWISDIFSVVIERPVILIGQALCKASRKIWAIGTPLFFLLCTNTLRVARSLATNS